MFLKRLTGYSLQKTSAERQPALSCRIKTAAKTYRGVGGQVSVPLAAFEFPSSVLGGTQCIGVPREQGTRYIGVHRTLGYTVCRGTWCIGVCTPYIEVHRVCGLWGCLGTRRRVLSGCRVMGVRRDLGPGAASRETPRFRSKKREFLPIKSLLQASNGVQLGRGEAGGQAQLNPVLPSPPLVRRWI